MATLTATASDLLSKAEGNAAWYRSALNQMTVRCHRLEESNDRLRVWIVAWVLLAGFLALSCATLLALR